MLRHQLQAIDDAGLTPSARLLRLLRDRRQPLADYGLDLAAENRRRLMAAPPGSGETLRLLAEESRRSLERQRLIEAADDLPFEEYLARYLA